MGLAIDRITLKGFKSIESLERFELHNLNVLIGANGAGKSNFVDYFRMVLAIAHGSFQSYVNAAGGGDAFLFFGPKTTSAISTRIELGTYAYEFKLTPTASGSLQIAEETVVGEGGGASSVSGSLESTQWWRGKDGGSNGIPGSSGIGYGAIGFLLSWNVYHFHDTTSLAPMRRDQPLRDSRTYRGDASNIASFLLELKEAHPGSYELIRDTVRLAAPFFGDFLFRPQAKGANELVRLEWQQKGSDFPFQPYQLSDGTIRFICLATALLQPAPPATIVIDEPELGLHPYAISLLADIVKSASERTQVIVSTQSPTLLDYFDPDQVVVVNRHDGRSTFERLDTDSLTEWLEDYSVGELWQKNVVRGGPMRE